MKYRPRKKRQLARSRTKPHNITVRPVLRDPPDYGKLVRAIMLMADEQVRKDKGDPD